MNLPESDFTYRRIYSYALSLMLAVLLALVVWQMDDSEDLKDTAFWIIIALVVTNTYYMVAPTAEQLPRIFASVKPFSGKDKE